MERDDLPNISEKTSSSFKLETVRQLWARFFSPVIIQVSLNRYLTRSLNSRISAGGIKEGFTIPHMYRSQIHLASLRSVLLPFWGFVYFGWERVTQMLFFSKILKTGIQYLPVDSIQTSVQSYLASQWHNSCRPLVKEEKRACLYTVRLLESVIPIQAKIHVLWTSRPQQLFFKILKDNKNTSWKFIVIRLTVTGHPAKSSRLWKR